MFSTYKRPLAWNETVRFDQLDLLSVATLGGLVSFLLTPVLARAARRWNVLDRPHGYKAHPAATPLLGGLGVAAGTVCGALWLLPRSDKGHLAGLSALA